MGVVHLLLEVSRSFRKIFKVISHIKSNSLLLKVVRFDIL
jgi:hypothetical protein